MIGQTISHYKILEKLGEGGMGIVYRAQDTTLNRDVALKFLPPYLASEPRQKERFLNEAQVASALGHPNVATIYEIDTHDEQIFIAMELVEGKTLKQLVKEGPLPIKKVLEIAIQICEGLTAAAEKGIIHRDIKSANIIFTPKDQVKIMDFGLAKIKGVAKENQAESTAGTAAYMSPEQVSGEEVDHRSDIFSFGVVLYELLTGKLPFKGEHPAGYAYSILNDQPEPLAKFNDKIPAELQRIVSEALEKNKQERYQHIDDLAVELRHVRKNFEYAKSPVVPREEAVRRHTRKLLKILLPTSALVILLLLLLIFNPFKFEVIRDQIAEASQNSLAVMYFENIPDPDDKSHTGEMLVNLLITSLSEARGLEVVSRERLYDIQKELGKADAEKITPSLATQIAQRAGVRIMLLGTIVQTEPQLAVTSRLIDVKSGKILSSQRLAGFSDTQLFPMVDSLAVLVRSGLNLTPAPPVKAKSVAEATTSSPEAYRSYLEGVELWGKFYLAEARAAFKRALELDSNFAMTYYRLAVLGDRVALQKAWKLRGKATEKERLAIEALYASQEENDLSKAASIGEELLRKYPLEQLYYLNLGSTYLGLNNYVKAIQTFETGLKHDSLDKNLLNLLAYTQAGLNQREQALSAIERYMRLAPGEPNPYDSKGEIFFVFGDVDSAVHWYEKAITFRADFPSSEKLGFNAVVRGDYPAAQRYFRQYGSTSDESQKVRAGFDSMLIPLHQGRLQQARGSILDLLNQVEKKEDRETVSQLYRVLVCLAFEEGNFPDMLEYAQKYSAERKKIPTDRVNGRDFLAMAWFKNGKPEKARQIAKELRRDIPFKRPEGWYDYFSAILSLEEGRGEEAQKLFEKALQPYFYNRAPQLSYGIALLKADRREEAIRELKRVSWWTPISTGTFNLDFLPLASYWPVATVKAHYWLGVAYEQQSNKAKAKEEYEKFLEIWKDADFNSPELADAKRRLERLKQKV